VPVDYRDVEKTGIAQEVARFLPPKPLTFSTNQTRAVLPSLNE
jgi:hypothetical protein